MTRLPLPSGPCFDHERLDVYRIALEFAALANQMIPRLPRSRGETGDELRRARNSIICNIAEGAGEFSGGERLKYYKAAKRSATECAGVLDLVGLDAIIEPEKLGEARRLLIRIVQMLVKMGLRKEGEGGGGERPKEPGPE